MSSGATYMEVLLQHLDPSLFRTLLQCKLSQLENDLYHLQRDRSRLVSSTPSRDTREQLMCFSSSLYQQPLLSSSLDLHTGLQHTHTYFYSEGSTTTLRL